MSNESYLLLITYYLLLITYYFTREVRSGRGFVQVLSLLPLCPSAFQACEKCGFTDGKIIYVAIGSAVYGKGNKYLIVRPDNFGVEKIVTYGVNDH